MDADYLALEDGGSVFREEAGSGPPLILTHDGLLHRETWDAQIDDFARHHPVVRWDRRGYGRSEQPQHAYSSVEALAQVVGWVPESPATLIGCSFGGLVSVHCALEYPELVAGLVLVGPIVSGLGLTEHFRTRGGHYRLEPDAALAEYAAYWSETDP